MDYIGILIKFLDSDHCSHDDGCEFWRNASDRLYERSEKKSLKLKLPEQRSWERLGGTLQSVRIAFFNFKHGSRQNRRKLGRYAANRF